MTDAEVASRGVAVESTRGVDAEDDGGAPDTDTEAVAVDGASVLIGPMRRRHLRGVMAIENSTNNHPWSQNLFLAELRNPTGRIYNVATDSHRVLGFCGLMIVADEGHITTIAVAPDVRRSGLAKRLLGHTIRQAVDHGIAHLTLEVRVSNEAALAMYRRFGFAPGGVRPRYYSSPVEDALIMWAHDVDTPAYAHRLEEMNV